MARKTKKMTIKYWNSLSKSTQKRALQAVFPIHPAIVDMLLDEKPHNVNDRGEFWWLVFKKVRIPLDGGGFWKTCINNTCYA